MESRRKRTTWVQLLIIFYIIYQSYCENVTFKCGPNTLCDCVGRTYVSMDCESKKVNISDICRCISNATLDVIALNAGNNGIGNISAFDLDGCESIVELDLHGNAISKIEEDGFRKLALLHTLDLSFNDIPTYENGWNSSFLPGSLVTLLLHRSRKAPASFATYPNLSHLQNLSSLTLDGLTNVEFPTSYRELNLRNLSLSSTHYQANCNLMDITNRTFANLLNVRTLDISGCGITRVYAGALENLRNLEELDISMNTDFGFDSLENATYGLQFTNVRRVNLSHIFQDYSGGNNICKQDLCYLWNTSLEEIDVSGNKIECIETNALILMPNSLRTIYVNYNNFVYANYLSQFGCMDNLTELFAYNLNQPFSNNLVCHGCGMNTMSTKSFSTCPFRNDAFLMEHANTKRSCQFINDSVPFPVTLPPPLKTIIVSYGNFRFELKALFPPLHSNVIQYLDVSGNNFTFLKGYIGPLPELQKLVLSDCKVHYIGSETLNYAELVNLQLDKNQLGSQLADETFSGIFGALKKLRILNLSRNGITVMHTSTFSPLIQLEALDLSYNNIEIFDINMDTLTNILYLYLSGNSIHTLSTNIRDRLTKNEQYLSKLFQIDLQANYISYDCQNQEFLKWIFDHPQNCIALYSYTFITPEGELLSTEHVHNDLQGLSSRCTSYTYVIVIATLGLSIFIVTVSGGLVYNNRWKIRYLIYMSKKSFLRSKRHAEYLEIENYTHDAFISYAEENTRFILDDFLPRLDLENVSLCLHQRDFLPGEAISDNIIHAIQSSRKTIVILSEAFLRSKWCMYEFHMARMERIYSRDDKLSLVVVMYENVPHNKMPLEMLEWIKQNNYIEYTEEIAGNLLFWEKMKQVIDDSN